MPLVARPGEPATVLLNAPQPVGGLGLDSGSGTVEPLRATAEIVRLGDPLGQLDDFAGPPRLPDLLCIGAQRSGTTWLHGALQAIPQVWACGIKEFHHFDWDGIDPTIGEFRQRQALALLAAHADGATAAADREQTVRMALRQAFPPVHSWENYAALFAAAPPDRLACDFTPSYATLGEKDVANIVRKVGSPRVKLLFDFYHVQVMNGDLIRRVEQCKDVIGHIHVAGCPGRGELDENQEIYFPPLMRKLLDIGYEGYVGQEFIPTRDALAGLKQAVAACDV
jgi:hypothetical protein